MVRTRAQVKASDEDQAPAESATTATDTPSKDQGQKRRRNKVDEGNTETDVPKDGTASISKKSKTNDSKSTQEEVKDEPYGIDHAKLKAIFDGYGVLPLQDSGLVKVTEATPQTILALVYLAMLTSARISHVLAYESVKCLLDAGYHDLEKLKKSTWQERTEVLTKGGYTRYREKTATALGELAEFVEKRYGT